MNGRSFLEIARELVVGTTEAHWRAAAGRAYYALMLEGWAALQRWGFRAPPRDNLHTFVRLRFVYAAEADLKEIGRSLERLSALRNQADYDLANRKFFTSAQKTHTSIQQAADAIARLDEVDGDAARRTAAIAAIRAAWP